MSDARLEIHQVEAAAAARQPAEVQQAPPAAPELALDEAAAAAMAWSRGTDQRIASVLAAREEALLGGELGGLGALDAMEADNTTNLGATPG